MGERESFADSLSDRAVVVVTMTWELFDAMMTLAWAELAICLILAAETLYVELRGD